MLRLDRALVERRLARSRAHAQQMISRGVVRLNGQPVCRSSTPVGADDVLTAPADPYVSRGAHKLAGALDDLRLSVAGRALDAGSSTGGFTQVLLERGCQEVYAVDVGRDQLAPGLRSDPRVHLHEQTNLRELSLDHTDGRPVDLVVADVSFISLVLLVAPLTAVLDPDGVLLLMIKPQFEVGRTRLEPDGVVRSADLHRAAVRAVVEAAAQERWPVHEVVPSRLPGPAGNREFFALFRTVPPARPVDLAAAVAATQ